MLVGTKVPFQITENQTFSLMSSVCISPLITQPPLWLDESNGQNVLLDKKKIPARNATLKMQELIKTDVLKGFFQRAALLKAARLKTLILPTCLGMCYNNLAMFPVTILCAVKCHLLFC